MALPIADLCALFVAFLCGIILRRYFIFTSGEKKTNLPFIKDYNIITGSKDILFVNNKVLMHNAHDRHKEFGDTFGCYFGKNMQIFSKDLDLVYKVCVSDFQKHRNRYYVNSLSPYMKASLLEARDNDWQNSRRAVGSVLKASKLKVDNVDTDIDATINRMLGSIDRRLKQKIANGGEPVLDAYQINKNFFLQSILKIVFNTEKLVDFDSDNNPAVEELHKFVTVNYSAVARIAFLIPILTDIIRPMLGLFEHGKYIGLLAERLEHIIKKEASSAMKERDPTKLTTIHSLMNSYKKGELSKNQLMGNAIFLMLAGFATSVDTMSALIWELAQHQDVQQRLRDDLLQYGEESKYLEQCINETLRLYPGSMTNRDLSEHIYHKDIRLLQGSCFNISIYSIHRDEKYWGKDANDWNPDRFEASKVKNHHPVQFIPFGIGPRNCVGYNLAKMELYKFTVQLILRYKFETCVQTQSKLDYLTLGALPFALPVKWPIYLKVTPTIS